MPLRRRSESGNVVSDFIVKAACDAYKAKTDYQSFRPHEHLMREALEVAFDLANISTYAQDAVRYYAALTRIVAVPGVEMTGEGKERRGLINGHEKCVAIAQAALDEKASLEGKDD